MRDSLLVLAGLLLAAIGVYLYLRRRRQPQATPQRAQSKAPLSPLAQVLQLKATERFWGYRIESHCSASSRFAGREFTFDDTPPLPVEGCDCSSCTCCLIGLPERRRLADRRSGQDRRRSIRMESNDRRAERPRRHSDLNSWVSYSHL